jgi:NAD(P)-dependent dehydrogenase (short-subunit alcohol dehydrogenase family)
LRHSQTTTPACERLQKTVIITGASQAIGAALVEAFAERGYGVVANSRTI